MQSDDRLDLMTLFVKIAEVGRLSEASRQLRISQASASRMLRRLEQLLDAPLVRRSTRGLGLTDEGRRFAEIARSMLEQWNRAAESFEDRNARLAGPIRVVVPIAIGQNLLASIFTAFVKMHPDVTIESDLRDDNVDLSRQGYDLQVRAGPVLLQSLIVREVWEVERAIVAAKGHPAITHPSELADRPAARLTTFVPTTVELTHVSGETALLKHRTVYASDNLYSILTAVREGLGFGILPLWATQQGLVSGDLVRLCPGWQPPKIVVSLVYPPMPLRARRLDALLAFLRYELTAEAGLGIAFLSQSGARSFVRTSKVPSKGS